MSAPERYLETGRLAELGLLASEMVHELRQPVFAIKALAQMMHGRVLDGDRAQMALLLDQVTTLETLLGRYAGSARRPSSLVQPVVLGPAVESGVILLRARAIDRGVRLVLDLVPDEAPVLADPTSIQQVTANLVANAIDAARSQVTVRTGLASLEVEDDGPGISPEVGARLFEPFYTTKPPGKGTGLGLAVVRHLVETAGGDVRWQSDDEGTRFTVSFRRLTTELG